MYSLLRGIPRLHSEHKKWGLAWKSMGCLLMKVVYSHWDLNIKEMMDGALCVHMDLCFLVCLVTLETGRRLRDGSGP